MTRRKVGVGRRRWDGRETEVLVRARRNAVADEVDRNRDDDDSELSEIQGRQRGGAKWCAKSVAPALRPDARCAVAPARQRLSASPQLRDNLNLSWPITFAF